MLFYYHFHTSDTHVFFHRVSFKMPSIAEKLMMKMGWEA